MCSTHDISPRRFSPWRSSPRPRPRPGSGFDPYHCRAVGREAHQQAACEARAARPQDRRQPDHRRSRPLARHGQAQLLLAPLEVRAPTPSTASPGPADRARSARTWRGAPALWVSPSAIVRLWLNSPPHRRVLFAKDLRFVGIGRATGRFQGTERRGGLHGRLQRTHSLILRKARPTSVGNCLGILKRRRCIRRGCSWQASATFAASPDRVVVAAPAANGRRAPHAGREGDPAADQQGPGGPRFEAGAA